mmetsp:Transcript_5763/g.13575  ORF Transcript_5763/g.13575 Transcript_5763/m.13575 type:complete len:533 (-) Transcript_5763:93-1691(-)
MVLIPESSVNKDATSITSNIDIECVPTETNNQAYDGNVDLVDVNLDDAMDELSEDSLSTDVEAGVEGYSDYDNDNDDDHWTEEEAYKPFKRSDSIATVLLNTLRDNNDSALDRRLGRRARDFAFAQSQRAGKPVVAGVLSLFYELAAIRADLQWAEDAAWRRENGKPYVSWEDYEHQRKQKCWKLPILSYAIMIALCCMMVYEFYLSGWKAESMKKNWTLGPPSIALSEAGAIDTLDMAENGSYYRLVSATFLHSGLIHLFCNASYVFLYGRAIEKNHGMTCLSLVYFLPSVAAFVWTALLSPGKIGVGASGGVFGLMGACVADIIVNWDLMFLVFKDHTGVSKCCLKLKSVFYLLLDLAFHLILGFLPFVDNFSHLGGFIYGFLAAFVVMERLSLSFFGKGNGFSKCRSLLYRFLAATAMAFAIAYSSVKLSQSDGLTNPYSTISNHVDCFEFPFLKEEKWGNCDQCRGSQLHFDVFEMEEDSNIFDKKIAKIELDCPGESRVVGDVSEFGFSATEDFSYKHRVGICQKLC